MPPRSYDQACSVANFLDLLSPRWSLLIVRDLLVGPRRFKELLAGLPGIGANRLSDRLRELQQSGILERTVDGDGQVPLYALTAKGRALEPVILAMARWGLQYLSSGAKEERSSRKIVRPDLLVVAFRAAFRPEAARHVRENYEFRIDDISFFVNIDDGRIETGLGTAEHPAFILITDAETFDRIAAGSLDVEDAQKRGCAEILGDYEAYERCAKMFSIREPFPELRSISDPR